VLVYIFCNLYTHITIEQHNGRVSPENYKKGILLLSTTYKILFNILLYRLTPYTEEITENHQSGFRRNRSTADHVFCIRQMLNKNGNTIKPAISSSLTLGKPTILLEGKSCIIILIEFAVPVKLIKLIKTCLSETYSRVREGKHLSEMFPIKNGLRQGDALSLLLFNFAVEHAITRVQVNRDGFELNDTHQFLVYIDAINPLNAELNPICHLLALLGAHHILHLSRIRVNTYVYWAEAYIL
jgi:hypothetical protein